MNPFVTNIAADSSVALANIFIALSTGKFWHGEGGLHFYLNIIIILFCVDAGEEGWVR